MHLYTIPITLINRVKEHEGLRLSLYKCPAGKITIGYGHNLEDNGITQDTANLILIDDLLKAKELCESSIGFFDDLDETRKCVLIEMCFQLGINGLLKFKKFLTALKLKQYKKASEEMKDSKWYSQCKNRVNTLSSLIELGEG